MDDQLPEATNEDADRASRYIPPEKFEEIYGAIGFDLSPSRMETLKDLGIEVEDREFKYGLRYSNYRVATTEELEAMDLENFKQSWDGVHASRGESEITEQLKRAYIDRRYWGPFSEQLDKLFGRMRERGDYPAAFGTRELLGLIRSARRGLAASLVHENIPPMTAFLRAGPEGYPSRGSPIELTNQARDVLKRSRVLCNETGERIVSGEQLLLALLEQEDSDVAVHLRATCIQTEPLCKKLRQFLGLAHQGAFSPRLRAFQLCTDIECELKGAILGALQSTFNDEWWAKGVPSDIRKSCATMREEEDCILSPESYMYLVQYKQIVKSNWSLFGPAIERASGERGKENATSWMNKLNPIRNAVMHPGKREITSEDLEALAQGHRIALQFASKLGTEKDWAGSRDIRSAQDQGHRGVQ